MSRTNFKSDRHAALDQAFPRTPSTYSLHAVPYRPAPTRRAAWWRRVLGAVATLPVVGRLYRHHRRGGMTPRTAFHRALATWWRDLNLNWSPR